MEESYVKGLANHDGPESCVEWSNPRGEALTGERAGWVLSREMNLVRDADPVRRRGRPQSTLRIGEACWYSARSETPGMYGNNLRENREILRLPRQWCLGRIVKSKDVRR
jgi:RNA-directed DNA polymerase